MSVCSAGEESQGDVLTVVTEVSEPSEALVDGSTRRRTKDVFHERIGNLEAALSKSQQSHKQNQLRMAETLRVHEKVIENMQLRMNEAISSISLVTEIVRSRKAREDKLLEELSRSHKNVGQLLTTGSEMLRMRDEVNKRWHAFRDLAGEARVDALSDDRFIDRVVQVAAMKAKSLLETAPLENKNRELVEQVDVSTAGAITRVPAMNVNLERRRGAFFSTALAELKHRVFGVRREELALLDAPVVPRNGTRALRTTVYMQSRDTEAISSL
eukprot:NODE_14030_length_1132_cov_11.191045.p1 GENE.NODE_14030_length_1132_cov_11.191045~~NODE_14030_length_1132_cov_11.191045.p1  ORF type:complete len:271 (-),score=36.11 NODE_14030_length_1132_cov_11.191045:240-1052(-)